MYTIALCDDEEKELDQIEVLLADYKDSKQTLEYITERFANAEALLQRIREERYMPDILLLDIIMSGKTGIEAAEEMRERGLDMPIIFLTVSREYALEAYEVNAVQYLVKPLNKERFFHAMDSVMAWIRRMEEGYVYMKVAGGVRRIQLDDVVCCESQRNYQIFYLTSEEHRVRMTAAKLWELLGRFPQFGRCGRSYIVNRDRIVSVERERIIMDNGHTIYIPQNKAAEFKKDYFSYCFDMPEL